MFLLYDRFMSRFEFSQIIIVTTWAFDKLRASLDFLGIDFTMDQTAGLSKGDFLALSDCIRAAKLLDRIFLEQVLFTL